MLKFVTGHIPTIDETYDKPSPIQQSLKDKTNITYDYSISLEAMSLQVYTVISSDSDKFERLEEFKQSEDKSNCVKGSLIDHMTDLGVNSDTINNMLKTFNFDSSKIHTHYHFGFR